MPYLTNEIARVTSQLQNAQSELSRLQQELAALIAQRDTAIANRNAAQSELDSRAGLIAERDQKTAQLNQAISEEQYHLSSAASHAAQASLLRNDIINVQAQIANLQGVAAQIPPLQQQLAQRQNERAAVNEERNALYRINPSDYPGGWYEWQRELNELSLQLGNLDMEINALQAHINNLQQQVAQIPVLQSQITTLDNQADQHDAAQAADTQAAAQRRATINTLQPRINELNGLLANVPTWRETVRVATETVNTVTPAIAAKQGSITSAQGVVTTWQTQRNRLTGFVTEIERTTLDRPALTQTAAELATELRNRQNQSLAARRRAAECTRRREVILAAKAQRAADLAAKNTEIATVQSQISALNGQISAKQNEAANAATAKASVEQQIANRPPRRRPVQGPNGEYNEAEIEAYWAWWDSLETLKTQYQNLLNQELVARQEQIALEAERTRAEATRTQRQSEASALQAEMNALDNEYNAQGVIADSATSEANGIDAVIPEYRVAREAATARLLGSVPSNLPLLLFPVRVETRFMTVGGIQSLRVRIYPDDIHVDTHELGLTAEEQTWGSHFWQATSTATNEATRRAAWEQLAVRFGPARAAWVARYFAEGRTLPPRTGSWTRSPYTEVLPDYWVVVGFRGDAPELTAWSTTRVQDVLAVGPAPGTSQSDPFNDPAVAWMTDFTQAMSAGMALQVPLTFTQWQNGFDRVLVVGVKAFLGSTKDAWQSADAQLAVTRLTNLLDAHHYTRGLGFVRQSTPTNNTTERASGYATPDPLDETGFTVERGPALVTTGDGSDGAQLAAALGVSADVFAHVRHANSSEQADARLANTALWPIMQSHFLEAILSVPASAAAGTHFAANVRGRGPFPVLRVGNQPYGVLPVTSLDRWVAQAGQEDPDLASRLRALRGRWRVAGERAAHSLRGDTMLRLLQHQPGADRYVIAGVGGVSRNGTLPANGVVAPFASRLGTLNQRPPEVEQALVAEALDAASFRLDAWATSLATRRLLNRPATPAGLLLGAYGWVEGLRPSGPRPSHGFLQAPSLAQATTAAILRSGHLAHHSSGDGDALAIDLSSDRVHRARWLLDGVRAGQSLGALLGYRFERRLQDDGLAEFIAPFRTLAVLLDDDVLAQAMTAERTTEAAHRDAQDALALAQLNFDAAVAAETAAQGKVTATTQARDRQTTLRTELTDAEALVGTRQGEVASATAAINAHQANKPQSRVNRRNWTDPDPAEGDVYLPTVMTLSQWQTELRNRQAAKADKVALHAAAVAQRDRLAGGAGNYASRLDAINQEISRLNGELTTLQSALTAAINARAQRELELHGPGGQGGASGAAEQARLAWVAASTDLRDLLEERWETASESIAAHNVVDGFELHRRWKIGTSASPPTWTAATIPWGDALMGLPALGSTVQVELETHLRALDETVDAVSDVLVAEGVHQLAQGNPTRAGTTLAAIASGEVAPPELEVIRTPRSGTAMTHRLVALAASTPPATPPWNAAADNPRAVAEPYLNQWVARLLPNPSSVRCRATYLDAATSSPVGELVVGLDGLACSPLDVLALPESTGAPQQSELEQRIAYRAMRSKPAGVPADAVVRLDFSRLAAWDAAVLSVAEFLEAVRAVRALVHDARGVDARDLHQPGLGLASGVDVGELDLRAGATRTALQQTHQTLASTTLGTNPESVRTALLRAAGFGVRGAVPTHPIGDTPELRAALLAQATDVARELQQRRARLAEHEQVVPAPDVDAQCAHHIARLRIMLGDSFLALPVFTPPTGTTQAFTPARSLAGTDTLTALGWVQRLRHVRPGVRRLHDALTHAEALATGATFTMRIGQLPNEAGDRWIGMAVPAGTQLPKGRLSIVAHAPTTLDLGTRVVGLMLDEWVEVVPNATELTGTAFHYNQPNGQAPQSLLVAVAPDQSAGRVPGAWDLDTLTDTLVESITLARTRAATPEALGGALWHTARRNDGSWEPFTLLDERAGTPASWQNIGLAALPAGTGQAVHVVAASQAGALHHAMRTASGSWHPFTNLTSVVGDRGAVSELAASAVGDTVHVCAVSPTGLWHTIRFANGTWQALGDVAGQAGHRGTPQRVACVGVGPDLHVLMITRDGKLWHTRRNADQSWTQFVDVEGSAGDRGFITNVCVGAVNLDLHVCVTSTSGVWHGIRPSSGTWSTFIDVRSHVGSRGYVESLACAGLGAELHVRTLTSDSRVWHTARLASGAWAPYHEVAGVGNARRVACTSASGVWHLLDLSTPPLPTTIHFDQSALDLGALPA